MIVYYVAFIGLSLVRVQYNIINRYEEQQASEIKSQRLPGHSSLQPQSHSAKIKTLRGYQVYIG